MQKQMEWKECSKKRAPKTTQWNLHAVFICIYAFIDRNDLDSRR